MLFLIKRIKYIILFLLLNLFFCLVDLIGVMFSLIDFLCRDNGIDLDKC